MTISNGVLGAQTAYQNGETLLNGMANRTNVHVTKVRSERMQANTACAEIVTTANTSGTSSMTRAALRAVENQ